MSLLLHQSGCRWQSISYMLQALIKNSTDKVDEGTKLANDSSDALKEIFEAIKKVRQLIQEMNAASNEQKSGLEQISQTVNQVYGMNASASEELSSTAEIMRGIDIFIDTIWEMYL